MIVHLHGGAGLSIIMSGKRRILNFLNRFFIKKLGSVIVLGKTHIDIFSGVLPKSKIHVIPNFAEDFLFLDEEEITRKFDESQIINFLFLSNLISGKGHVELVDAFLKLDIDLRERIVINFAGGFESEKQKLEFLNKIKDISGINYLGMLSGAEKRNIFSQSQIFCLPTYYPYEGQPISILEAYATGCVVITTNHSGIPDIFTDGINGIEVRIKSSGSIKSAIEKILSDPTHLKQIALSNRKIAYEKYRTSIFNKSVTKVFEELKPN
jgi:glycosyltransferase involved in cell wall biosynthesis